MIMITHDQAVPERLHHAVVAIGNFDGVHLGHADLLGRARSLASKRSAPLVVLTFTPHPRRFFRPDDAPFLLTPGVMQHDRLATHAVEGVVTVAFDQPFSHLSPEQFINQILHARLHAQAVVVGTDFHFGHNRAGNIDTLRQAGFLVETSPLIRDTHGVVISSTRVRGCLAEGHIDEANALLGWNWFLHGMVVHGDARGRTLGYPTANIWLHETVAPAHGIYAAWVTLPNKSRHMAAVAIGRRPMFEVPQTLCEAHLLNFTGDLYDQILAVEPVRKLRDEARFDTLDALVAQMKKDCDSARNLLTYMINKSNEES